MRLWHSKAELTRAEDVDLFTDVDLFRSVVRPIVFASPHRPVNFGPTQ